MKSSFLEQRKSLTNGFDTSTMTSMAPLPESLKANSLMGDYHRPLPAKEPLKINTDSIPNSKDLRANADDSRAATLHAIKERLMLSKSKAPLQLDANELPKKQIENFPSVESSVFSDSTEEARLLSPRSILKEPKVELDFSKRLLSTNGGKSFIERSPRVVSFKQPTVVPFGDSVSTSMTMPRPVNSEFEVKTFKATEISEKYKSKEYLQFGTQVKPAPLSIGTSGKLAMTDPSNSTAFNSNTEKMAGNFLNSSVVGIPNDMLDIIQNTLKECLEDYSLNLKQDLQNIHVDLLKQFHLQKVKILI